MDKIIAPLPFKEIARPDWWGEDHDRVEFWERRLRTIFFDPKEIYERVGNEIDRYRRVQKGLNLALMFPKRADGICRCGCNKPAKKSWAGELCSGFALNVYYIICYGTQSARKFIETYYGENCVACGGRGCEIDHIIPVKHGGGGCWLSNLVPLCSKCHRDKTKKDFNWGEYKVISQTRLPLTA